MSTSIQDFDLRGFVCGKFGRGRNPGGMAQTHVTLCILIQRNQWTLNIINTTTNNIPLVKHDCWHQRRNTNTDVFNLKCVQI